MLKKIKKWVADYKQQVKTIKTIAKGTMLMCPNCKSPCVSHGASEIKEHDLQGEIFIQESYMVNCENCKSIGKVVEYWGKHIVN